MSSLGQVDGRKWQGQGMWVRGQPERCGQVLEGQLATPSSGQTRSGFLSSWLLCALLQSLGPASWPLHLG